MLGVSPRGAAGRSMREMTVVAPELGHRLLRNKVTDIEEHCRQGSPDESTDLTLTRTAVCLVGD